MKDTDLKEQKAQVKRNLQVNLQLLCLLDFIFFKVTTHLQTGGENSRWPFRSPHMSESCYTRILACTVSTFLGVFLTSQKFSEC